MTVDGITVIKIAHLARLHIEPEQVEAYKSELNGILDWMNELENVDIGQIREGMTCVQKDGMRQREDLVTDGGYVSEIIANAPKSELNMFAVPKVVE